MPRTLSTPAVAEFRDKLQRLLEHEQEAYRLREEIAKAQKELTPHAEAIEKLQVEIRKELRAMDVDSPANAGWEGRAAWFVKELYEQTLAYARDNP